MGKRPMGKKRGGLWELPGGKVDEDEDPRAALAREWMEELDVQVYAADFIGSAVLELEVPLVIDLYAVRAVRRVDTWKTNAHDIVEFKNPEYMMEYEPCSPAFYLHYPWMKRWIAS